MRRSSLPVKRETGTVTSPKLMVPLQIGLAIRRKCANRVPRRFAPIAAWHWRCTMALMMPPNFTGPRAAPSEELARRSISELVAMIREDHFFLRKYIARVKNEGASLRERTDSGESFVKFYRVRAELPRKMLYERCL